VAFYVFDIKSYYFVLKGSRSDEIKFLKLNNQDQLSDSLSKSQTGLFAAMRRGTRVGNGRCRLHLLDQAKMPRPSPAERRAA
jgi:hypothetical protein